MMSISLFLILMLLTTLVASSVLALAYGWKLGLIVVFSGMPVLIGCGYARFRFERQLETKTQGRFAACAALASEVVTSIRTVASLTLEDQICEEYDALLDGIAKTAVGTMTWTILGLAFSQSLEFLLFALGFWYGAQLLADGDYTVTQVFVSFLAVVFGGQAAGQIFGFTVSMSAARSAANYILWARTLNPSIAEDDAYANIKPPKNGILGIEEVEFAHQQRKTSVVLKCINMQVRYPLLFYISFTAKIYYRSPLAHT
jgi:ATP-binding cassette subfamily B (MDR/TAP) protein 1